MLNSVGRFLSNTHASFSISSFCSVRLNVDQWLQRTLQHNSEIQAICMDSDDPSMIQKEVFINQLIVYLHHEFEIFDRDFLSLVLEKYLHRPEMIHRFQQRIQHIKSILQEKKDHQEIIKQIHHTDQMIKDLERHPEKEEILQKYQHYKEDFRRINERECSEVQPLLGTRLELAIRTLDADLQLIEHTIEGKTLPDLTSSTSRITRKISQQPTQSIESEIHDRIILIRDNLSKLQAQIQVQPSTTDEQQISHNILQRDIVSAVKLDISHRVEYCRMIDFERLKKNIPDRN